MGALVFAQCVTVLFLTFTIMMVVGGLRENKIGGAICGGAFFGCFGIAFLSVAYPETKKAMRARKKKP